MMADDTPTTATEIEQNPAKEAIEETPANPWNSNL